MSVYLIAVTFVTVVGVLAMWCATHVKPKINFRYVFETWAVEAGLDIERVGDCYLRRDTWVAWAAFTLGLSVLFKPSGRHTASKTSTFRCDPLVRR